MKWFPRLAPALLALVFAATPAGAFVPQTIVVDGTNDFDPSNLIDDDTGDTQIQNWCTNDPENDSPMDLRQIYITNDNSYLYIGYFYDRECFASPQVNLGFAIDVGTGGTNSDPFGRKLGWAQAKSMADTTISVVPDYVVYDVQDGFNYEILYETNGAGGWNNISVEVNPSWGGGSNGLGISDAPPFVEFRIPLSVLNFARAGGAIAGDVFHVEWWMTQDGTTKPPLDLAASDARQKSTVSSTTFDVATIVQANRMFRYVVQGITDVTPPTVLSALAVGFPVLPNGQFGLTTNKVDVTFSEPVELASSQVTGNYSLPGAPPITGAVRDPAVNNIVHLTLASGISASASFRNLTVTGVRDLASNTIVNNGTTNVSSFFIQNLKFECGAQAGLCNGSFAASDTFAVEGNLNPLSFGLCDNALMTDANADSVYDVTVPFAMLKNAGTGKAEADLEWKLSHDCTEYEPFGGNRAYHLSSDNGANVTLFAYWGNLDPTNFTDKAIDVVFQVNASLFGPGTVTLLGSELPLSFTQPGVAMTNIGGNIYQATVRFPKCTNKNVNWKVDYNGVIECLGQGDRHVFLNDDLFGIIGSAEGPITLPARGIDRCTVTDKAVKVVFKLDMQIVTPNLDAADTVAVMGDVSPLTFTPPPPAAARMFDNGLGFDTTPNDQKFACEVVFPDSSNLNLGFKYWYNSTFECLNVGNRTLSIDDVNYSVANPLIRSMNYWDYCSDVVGVPDDGGPRPVTPTWAVLRQNVPNPFNPTTLISFELKSAGRTTLTIYDILGRKVRDIVSDELGAGEHSYVWDGTAGDGRAVSSGLYFYELSQAGQRMTKRMVILQ